jgi:hypothetical protein
VPFWLQILSIALAPLLGFAGVAIGVAFSERNRRDAYVKEERRKVYVDYLEATSQLTAFVTFERPKKGNPEGIEKNEAFADKAAVFMEQLQRTYMSLSVIGSPEACEAAVQAFTYLELATRLALATMRGKSLDEGWSKLGQLGTQFQDDFIDAARKDLGLRSGEWKIRPELIKQAEESKVVSAGQDS